MDKRGNGQFTKEETHAACDHMAMFILVSDQRNANHGHSLISVVFVKQLGGIALAEARSKFCRKVAEDGFCGGRRT